MGVNNKQRRAAKRRRNARTNGGSTTGNTGQSGGRRSGPAWDPIGDAFLVADQAVWAAIHRLAGRKSDEADAWRLAQGLERRLVGEHHVLEAAVASAIGSLVEQTVAGGWSPADLAQLVARSAHARHLPTLAAALHRDRRAHDRGIDWQAACDRVGPGPRMPGDSTSTLASALVVGAALAGAPLLHRSAAQPVVSDTTHPKLAKVRALLAKAESTPFDEEAEALSAKAQELIARYSLGRLLHQGSSSDDDSRPQVRRLWLDAPYVAAKASLVHAVAAANRCRAAASKRHGFSVVVGSPRDLEAVELLVTSLLVQADAAMLRHARRAADPASSRAFRQSFLLAYAARIGELLSAAVAGVASAGDDRLLPVLLDHETRVGEAFEAMVPHAVSAGPAIRSAAGWAAGTAAADLARLDVNGQLSGREARDRAAQ